MIASLKGKVLSKRPEGIIVEVGGIGYHVSVPLCSLGNIPDNGGEVFLHTYTYVREDTLQLYGFLSEEERKLFTTLLEINGIGPKLGLAILSGMPVRRFMEAVMNEDVSLLSAIPGLGRKTASRLILELKERLPKISAYPQEGSAQGDAVSALVNLGYKKSLSERAVETAIRKGASSVEDIIKEALRYLTENK